MIFRSVVVYVVSALFWLTLLLALKASCIFNAQWNIERLFTKSVHNDFVENIIGELAFHVKPSEFPCDAKFIYKAKYYPNGVGSDFQVFSLKDVVDTASWEELERSPATTTYSDKNYRYILYNNSDGIYMGIFDK